MDIYAAREVDDGTISSKDVSDLVNKNGTKAFFKKEAFFPSLYEDTLPFSFNSTA